MVWPQPPVTSGRRFSDAVGTNMSSLNSWPSVVTLGDFTSNERHNNHPQHDQFSPGNAKLLQVVWSWTHNSNRFSVDFETFVSHPGLQSIGCRSLTHSQKVWGMNKRNTYQSSEMQSNHEPWYQGHAPLHQCSPTNKWKVPGSRQHAAVSDLQLAVHEAVSLCLWNSRVVITGMCLLKAQCSFYFVVSGNLCYHARKVWHARFNTFHIMCWLTLCGHECWDGKSQAKAGLPIQLEVWMQIRMRHARCLRLKLWPKCNQTCFQSCFQQPPWCYLKRTYKFCESPNAMHVTLEKDTVEPNEKAGLFCQRGK